MTDKENLVTAREEIADLKETIVGLREQIVGLNLRIDTLTILVQTLYTTQSRTEQSVDKVARLVKNVEKALNRKQTLVGKSERR